MKKVLIILIFTGFFGMSYQVVSFAADTCAKDGKGWCPPSAGPVTAWTAPLCAAGRLLAQPFFFYNRTRGAFNDEGRYKSFKNKETKLQAQQFLFFQYGITDKLEFDGQGLFQENMHHQDGKSAEYSGFGDTLLFLRYCAIEETKWLPQISALFQLKMPTGKYQKLDDGKLGTDQMGATSSPGSYDHGYGVIFTKKLKPFIFHADLIYTFPVYTRVNDIKTKYANYVNCDFAIEYFLPKGFNLMLETNWFGEGDRKADGIRIPASDINTLTISPGIGWSDKKIQTLLAYQRTLAGTNADVNDSIVFTFTYTF